MRPICPMSPMRPMSPMSPMSPTTQSWRFASIHDLVLRMFRSVLILGLFASVSVAQPIKYPEAKKGDVGDDYFGMKVADPYRWLENTDSPETTAWVKAEDEATSAYLEK